MRNILLVYLPFCTPASPPYSLVNLYTLLKKSGVKNVSILDLNLEFHKLKFPQYHSYFKNPKQWDDYDSMSHEYHKLTEKTYAQNNKKVIQGEFPELFEELLDKISSKNPDIIIFSLVYSSQAFYAYSLLKELSGITKIIGGPAVNAKLSSVADLTLSNYSELLNYLQVSENKNLNLPDFSSFPLTNYFTPAPVIPLRTSTTCYYQKCAFCSHFLKIPYVEYPLDSIKEVILASNQKYFFLIDDMIHVKRLLLLAELFKPLNIHWACQLKPTADFDYNTLKKLKDSGLDFIIWGVESGNDRILKLMNKGTKVLDIEKVLLYSHQAGIKNMLYILIGFPTETKEEFLDTINFLKKNGANIDLILTSVFGLQSGSIIYQHPEKFGIKKVIEEKRTILNPKISYELVSGLSQAEANKLVKTHKRTFENINKYPKMMNFFREHLFFIPRR